MRRCKRIIYKQFGGVGNFFAIIILVSITVIFINTYVLTKKPPPTNKLPEINLSTIELVKPQNQTKSTTPKPKPERSSIPDAGCEIDDRCSEDTFPYKVISGDGIDKYPIICFNNKLLVHRNLKDSKIGRGVNVVVIDGNSFEVKLTDTFDTYAEENFFLRALKVGIDNGDIIMLASFDEMTYALREASLSLLEKYGSQLIKVVKFRDSFVMMGQKGLARGKAIEMHQPKGKREYGAAAHISGCAKFPLGQITPLTFPTMEVNKGGTIAVGSSIKNCGLIEACKDNEFAVHVYTGKDNNDEPKICVDGKYVIGKGINDAGRGLNIVVVSNGKEVIRTGHFDTWQEDSTNLEIFLENLEDNVILIVVTFDEASQNFKNFTRSILQNFGSEKISSLAFHGSWAFVHHLKTHINYKFEENMSEQNYRLSQHSKNLFFDLGSATIQNLKYRDVWVLIGQKGIQGFSPYEEISYAGQGNTYATPIDKRMCVPQTLKGIRIRPDPIPYRNDKRRDFCSRYDGYGDFCSDINIDKSLVPVPLINKTLEDNPIYSTPILVIAGISHNSLRMCLETLLMQPGIHTENVIVAVDEKFSESLALIDLFGFRGEKTPSSSTYTEHYQKSLKKIWETHSNKDKVIVIEEDLILSPDFLYTLALLSEVFRKDETIDAIQMWNPNSYEVVNGSIELIYRVNQFYGLGYLLRRSFYEKNILNSFQDCCFKRVWDKWVFPESSSFLVPDVSRVFRRPFDSNRVNTKHIELLFNQKRKTNLNPFPSLSNIDLLRKDKYETDLIQSINSATLIKSLHKCQTINNDMFQLIDNQNISNTFKFIYDQESINDYRSLTPILPCFGLYSYEPLGIYRGILRFYSNKYYFYLIGSKSSLYSNT